MNPALPNRIIYQPHGIDVQNGREIQEKSAIQPQTEGEILQKSIYPSLYQPQGLITDSRRNPIEVGIPIFISVTGINAQTEGKIL